PGANQPSLRIQAIGDGNGSSHLAVLNKLSGDPGNALVERLRTTNTGVVQIPGSLTVPSITGAVGFAGAVTMSTLGVTCTLSATAMQLTGAAETSVTPLEIGRDYLGNTRSLVDHNGYRMGQ